MQKVTIILILITGIMLSPVTHQVFAGTKQHTIVPGQIIIKLKTATEGAGRLQSAHPVFAQCQALDVKKLFGEHRFKFPVKSALIGLDRIYEVKIPETASVEDLCRELNQQPGIAYAEPVYLCETHAVPNDSLYSEQYYLPQISAEEAWDVAGGDSSVIIAIVDTGVDWDHPDLAPIIWKNPNEVLDGTDTDLNGYIDDVRGWDFVTGVSDNAAAGEDGDEPDNNPMDFDGHGTHCSGLAAAVSNNLIGIASIGNGCRIMPLRVGYHTKNDKGLGNSSWMARAFIYAADNGASVVNLSFGNSGNAIRDAAEYAFMNGVVICSSAGNANVGVVGDALDGLPFIVTVAALDRHSQKSMYSNFGDWVTVSAPGGNHDPGLLSTVFNDTYEYYSGTSMSSPFTAGLFGLVKSQHPDWSPGQLMFQVVETADNIDDRNPNYVGQLGTGQINAYRALTETVNPLPKIEFSYYLADSATGNANGIADIGENVQLVIELQNTWGTATNLTATLQFNDWAADLVQNTSQWGTFYGIEDLAQNKISNATEPFEITIDSLALPHRILATVALTADNGFLLMFPVVIPIQPTILFIDDDSSDDSAPEDISRSYISVLDELGYSFDSWDYMQQGIPGIPTGMGDYVSVVWGCEATIPSLDNNDRYRISKHLDAGGNLFLSGQDIGWDLCDEASENKMPFGVKFYNDILHAEYLADNSGDYGLTGVPGDPISDNLEISISPLSNAEPSPDVIQPLEGGIPIFKYSDGSAGAMRYENDYRMVYFSFGGYEMISNPETRKTVMARTLNWLNGLEVHHKPLSDTENTTEDYEVKVIAKSATSPLAKVEMYWDADGSLPFAHKTAMTALDDSTFQASIPAQDSGQVIYTIFVQNEAGFYHSYEFHTFKIGSDNSKPVISVEDPLSNTLDIFGPYNCQIKITDNQAVDTSSVWLFYGIKDAPLDSLKMTGISDDVYHASFPGKGTYGDTLTYYASAKDVASTPNYNIGEPETFILGHESFEDKTLRSWERSAEGWQVDTAFVRTGRYAITESPGRNLGPGEEHTIQLKSALDLSGTENAILVFWSRYNLHRNKAFGYVEVSQDSGSTWEEIYSATGIRRAWGEVAISLAGYIGQENLLFRLRVTSAADANDRFDGWYVDDIQLRIDVPTQAEEAALHGIIPAEFSLLQNYPNPFNPATTIRYGLPKAAHVSLTIYNLLGQQVKALVNYKQKAGLHQIAWDGTNNAGQYLSSGLYFYKLETESFSRTRKMMWMK